MSAAWQFVELCIWKSLGQHASNGGGNQRVFCALQRHHGHGQLWQARRDVIACGYGPGLRCACRAAHGGRHDAERCSRPHSVFVNHQAGKHAKYGLGCGFKARRQIEPAFAQPQPINQSAVTRQGAASATCLARLPPYAVPTSAKRSGARASMSSTLLASVGFGDGRTCASIWSPRRAMTSPYKRSSHSKAGIKTVGSF